MKTFLLQVILILLSNNILHLRTRLMAVHAMRLPLELLSQQIAPYIQSEGFFE